MGICSFLWIEKTLRCPYWTHQVFNRSRCKVSLRLCWIAHGKTVVKFSNGLTSLSRTRFLLTRHIRSCAYDECERYILAKGNQSLRFAATFADTGDSRKKSYFGCSRVEKIYMSRTATFTAPERERHVLRYYFSWWGKDGRYLVVSGLGITLA